MRPIPRLTRECGVEYEYYDVTNGKNDLRRRRPAHMVMAGPIHVPTILCAIALWVMLSVMVNNTRRTIRVGSSQHNALDSRDYTASSINSTGKGSWQGASGPHSTILRTRENDPITPPPPSPIFLPKAAE